MASDTPSRNKAVLWAILFGAGTTVLRKAGTRYFMGEPFRVEWDDVKTALLSGTISYFSFRRDFDGDFNFGE